MHVVDSTVGVKVSSWDGEVVDEQELRRLENHLFWPAMPVSE